MMRCVVVLAGVVACASQRALAQPAANTQPGARAAASGSVRELLQTARRESQDGDAAGAFESLRRARALAPNSEDVLSAFAQVALSARLLAPAIATLESLTRMCPTVAQYGYLLGVALIEAGDMPAAVDSLEQANRLEPDRPRTLLALALALNNRKQYAEARRAALKSLELDADNVDTLATLAEAEAGTGDLQQADAHARRVLARSPTHHTANLVAGIVLMQQERYVEARDALEQAAAANPASAAVYYQLSLAYARLGDETRSRQNVERYRQTLRESEERIKALRAGTSETAR
jgi:tetratricopeptide (TPR) repeat protein